MRERDRIALDQWHRELQAEEEAAREERERPIRELTSQLSVNHGRLLQAERTTVLSGRDDAFEIDPLVKDASMSQADAERYNGEQAERFVNGNPDYYASPNNQAAIVDYLDRQGVQIASAQCFQSAYERLLGLGLLEQAPEPEPEPEPTPVQLPVQHPEHSQRLWDGWDVLTGLPRQYTQFEIDRMNADTFRVAMRIPTVIKRNEANR